MLKQGHESTFDAISALSEQLVDLREQVRNFAEASDGPPRDAESKLGQIQLAVGHKLLPKGSSRERFAKLLLRRHLRFRSSRTNINEEELSRPTHQQLLHKLNAELDNLTRNDGGSIAKLRIEAGLIQEEILALEKKKAESLTEADRFIHDSSGLGCARMFASFRNQDLDAYKTELAPVQIIAFYRGKDPRYLGDEFSAAVLRRPAFVQQKVPVIPLEPIDPALAVPEVIEEHCRLAYFHGVSAFAADYYWHPNLPDPNKMLETLSGCASPLKFCANWRVEEAGAVDEERAALVFEDLKCHFLNERYLKVDNRPILVIETTNEPAEFEPFLEALKRLSKEAGLEEPYVIYAALKRLDVDPRLHLFDGATRMALHRELENDEPTMMYKDQPWLLDGLKPNPKVEVFSYSGIVGRLLRFLRKPCSEYQTVFTSYDFYERFQRIVYAYPKFGAFQAWLQRACSTALAEGGPDFPLVFVKSWNDWHAGCYLLPDARQGYSSLGAIRQALNRTSEILALQSPEAKMQAQELHEAGLKQRRYDLSCYIKGEPGKNPIILYQIGKVGSSTVIKSIRNAMKGEPVLGMHNLTKLQEGIDHALAHLPNPAEALRVLQQGVSISEWMETLGDDYKFRVITMVKDPIARNISHFFHAVDSFWPMFRSRLTVGDITMEEVRDTFLGLFLSFRFEDWFETHFEPVFPIGVSTMKYEHGKGYAIADSASGRHRVMVMRSRDINRVLPAATKEFIGVEVPVLKDANTAEDKFYSDVYRKFKKLPLPAWYVDKMLNDKVVENFYSAQEREEMFYSYTTGS